MALGNRSTTTPFDAGTPRRPVLLFDAPEDHRTFYVATEDYQREHPTDRSIPAMGNGFPDGVRSDFLTAGLDDSTGVCVYVTPVHEQAPDVETDPGFEDRMYM